MIALSPVASWAILAGVLAIVAIGTVVLTRGLAIVREIEEHEALERAGWIELGLEVDPGTVRSYPAPYDREQEGDPI